MEELANFIREIKKLKGKGLPEWKARSEMLKGREPCERKNISAIVWQVFHPEGRIEAEKAEWKRMKELDDQRKGRPTNSNIQANSRDLLQLKLTIDEPTKICMYKMGDKESKPHPVVSLCKEGHLKRIAEEMGVEVEDVLRVEADHQKAIHRLLEEIKAQKVNGKNTSKDVDEKKKKTDIIIELALDNAMFFHDQLEDPFAIIKVGDHKEIYHLKTQKFKNWLAKLYWKEEGGGISSNTVRNSLNTLNAIATFDSPQRTLHNRVCLVNDSIYYDLSNEKWQVVKINKEGWEIVENPELFKRYAHQKSQPWPERTDAKELLSLLEPFLCFDAEEDAKICIPVVVSFLVPSIPHFLVGIYGDQGGTKSTFTKVINSLIDNTLVEKLSLPSEKRELVQQLNNRYFAGYDNLSHLPEWASNVFSRAITGAGFTKRKLYTDEEDVIWNFQRTIALNGIGQVVTKSDLMERALLFKMRRPNPFKKEKAFWSEFNQVKQKILGAMFSVLSKAMGIVETQAIEPPPHLRMVDSIGWCEAISQALGERPNQFIQLYLEKCSKANELTIELSPIGEALRTFIQEREAWTGKASKLLQILDEIGEREHLNVRSKSWPKAPNALTRRLNELKVNFEQSGISIEQSTHDRTLSIRKIPSQTLQPSRIGKELRNDMVANATTPKQRERVPLLKFQGESDDNNDSNGISGYSCGPDARPSFGICEYCGREKEIWINEKDGRWVCSDCLRRENEQDSCRYTKRNLIPELKAKMEEMEIERQRRENELDP